LHQDNAIVNHSGGNGRFGIRQGNWKLELCPGSGGWGRPGDAEALKEGLPPIQLYNLRADVGERVNLQARNAALVTNMVKLLEKYVTDGRTTPGPPQPNDVPVNIWSNKSAERDALNPHRPESRNPKGAPELAVQNNSSPYQDPPPNDPTFGN
jgi:hypothetical protein